MNAGGSHTDGMPPMPLNASTPSTLPATVSGAEHDRVGVRPGVVHIGVGGLPELVARGPNRCTRRRSTG